MRIGFIGIGKMGEPMARNVLKAGHELRVYNRSPGKGDALVSDGAVLAGSPAELAGACEVVVSMLSDDAALHGIVAGEHGLLGNMADGAVHVSLSTVSPEAATAVAKQHEAKGESFVAGAVFGRPDAAAAAKLWVCVCGRQAAKDRVQPVLETIGQRVFDTGEELAAANTVKLGGNFMIAAALEAMGEAFTLVEKHGVARQDFAEIISQSLFACPVYQGYGPAIAKQQYEPAMFKLALGRKDMALALALADQRDVPMPLAHLVHDRLTACVAKGRANLDWSGLALEASEAAGD